MEIREKLVGLLDYVEQVVRLDERVAFRLSDYRLPDGSTFALHPGDTHGLPGIRHNLRDDGEPVWLEVERLARTDPPRPPVEIADWIGLSPDPTHAPQIKQERLVTVTALEKDEAFAKGEVEAGDVADAPQTEEERARGVPKKFDLCLRLNSRPNTAAAIDAWIAGPWTEWAGREAPRRRTISIYQKLYKIFQLLETGAAESPVEVAWGIGVTHWKTDGRIIERPLLERRVEVELDDRSGGLIRVRPTTSATAFDLKHFEEVGCNATSSVADLIQRELRRAEDDDGVSPFAPETFDVMLSAVANRLHPEGTYAAAPTEQEQAECAQAGRLLVTGQWALFARPRSQHVVLQDISRLKSAAGDATNEILGLAASLVSQPSSSVSAGVWSPLADRIGGTTSELGQADSGPAEEIDVFFPKPFNADQVEIVRRLERTDGLVVQGPPGTGKTHTIANLICHSMATGRRVLVVSRGESALSVLRDQLPSEVQPLAIAVNTSERQGLKQIESAIRQVQSIVDESRPDVRRNSIVRLEREIAGLQTKISRIDEELDQIAERHLAKIGPGGESAAEIAKRIVDERKVYAWFADRPSRFAVDCGLADREWADLDDARRRAGSFIDHADTQLPAIQDLPSGAEVKGWHTDIVRAGELATAAKSGPARGVHISLEESEGALEVADCLERVKEAHAAWEHLSWLKPVFTAVSKGRPDLWSNTVRERVAEWKQLGVQRAKLAARSVEFPSELLGDRHACEAVQRAANGERLWPLLHVGKSVSKALTAQIKLDGLPPRDPDAESWRHILAVVQNSRGRVETLARWVGVAKELGGAGASDSETQIAAAEIILIAADELHRLGPRIQAVFPSGLGKTDVFDDPAYCSQLAAQLRAAVAATRLSQARAEVERVRRLFEGKTDRTSVLGCQMMEAVIGSAEFEPDRVEQVWNNLLSRLDALSSLRLSFETILGVTTAIGRAGCPIWAQKLRTEAFQEDQAPLANVWRAAWDFGAAEQVLQTIDARQRIGTLTAERNAADSQRQKLLGEVVRERTFYELNRRLSPSVKSALVEFVRALARIGKGTGKGAGQNRAMARDAMSRCYDAVPCWIMPTWRVAEQLPAEIGAIDLVIIDEASQSDVTELPALLRGKKLLVVGDDRQVSPTPPFVTQNKIEQLRHHYLKEMPFKSLLEPGESIYDLMRAVFPEHRLMLKEHFRCVEPIIRFSMQFYPETMLPLRVPAAHERLDPPLVDIYVPHGVRDLNKKINRPECEVIVEEIKALTARSGPPRSIGVISLIGAEQAEFIRARLSEAVGEEVMQRHSVLCGDSATFQGTERDVVFLSMVADSAKKSALTALQYEQRFNVAVSRGRDRVVLVRSVRREELRPSDLKARLIAHFENPMPSESATREGVDRCESEFERDVLRLLLEKGYRARPQVGTLGYRIDIVVDGGDGRRLAVECDGDRFHGPEQWRHDMRRQRVLERVGWRFWRCFASSFYRDRDGVTNDLLATLEQLGIQPLTTATSVSTAFTEFRVVESEQPLLEEPIDANLPDRVAVGDRVNLRFADDKRRMSVRLTGGASDLARGQLSVSTPLGRAIVGAEEGDEIEFETENGLKRVVLLETMLPRNAETPAEASTISA